MITESGSHQSGTQAVPIIKKERERERKRERETESESHRQKNNR